ncbi:MAG: hypothetical protein IPM54_14005 [Polyangiaceae bacterium]|nr:hypothetical protein [Polyangiaceae bacterium]
MFRPLPTHRAQLAATLVAFFAGALLGFTFLLTDAPWPVPTVAAALVTAAFVASRTERRRLRLVGLFVVFAAYALWTYELLAFGEALYWTIRWPVWALVVAFGFAAVLTHGPSWKRVEVPFVLPMGVVIAACLWGWRTEETRIRCEDWRAVAAQSEVKISIPTIDTPCIGDEAIPIARFPRHVSESPDGASYLFTTQMRNPTVSNAMPAPGRFSGSICTSPRNGSSPPTCTGVGTSQGMAESEPLDRFFVANWGPVREGGRRGGRIYAVARSHPLRVLAERELDILSGELFHDPIGDIVGVFNDDADFVYPFRASTLEPLEPMFAPIIPGDTHFDPVRREGVCCFAVGPIKTIDGHAFAAVAFATDPFRLRPLAPSNEAPWMWFGFSWGCDWDPANRRAYAAIASLGILHEIDYDSGSVLRTFYTGMGVRSVAYDRKRHRLYLGHYLTGKVGAVDLSTGKTIAEWFAGRFVRTVVLSRDARRLIATSNAGIVEIDLPD